MPQYDFRSLSPIDFEILVRDLLQKELKLTLESFKAGRDSGIDFRYARATGDLIVQCKHYAESTHSTLLSAAKQEVDKIRKLSPKRYILVTSRGLTPEQKTELVKVLHPFVRSSGDVIGREDLNNLLGLFPDVERHTPKLWLSSTTVFEEILHSKVRNVSRESLEKIRERSRLYVQNDSFAAALSILDQHNVCIIAGIPGIGKTTLAEMLVLQFVNLGYELVQIDHDIAEAQELATGEQKKVYYYDDFLGQISIGEKLNKNEEQRLLNFMEAVKKSKSSKLILTTREYILNQAKLLYEKIDRARFDPETCIVDLAKYTRMIRAQILFNHLYFSDLPRSYLEALIAGRIYLKVIDHPNYNPRIIEQMTQPSHIREVEPGRYGEIFLRNLANPAEIWNHAFNQQLSEPSRSTLVVMASSLATVPLPELQEAVEAFHFAKCRQFGIGSSPRDFNRALKELEGNFITVGKQLIAAGKEVVTVAYHNPSVRDFVRNYLASASHELGLLIRSSVFFEQLATLWSYRDDTQSGKLFAEALKAHIGEFLRSTARTLYANDMVAEPRYLIWRRSGRMSFERRVTFLVTVSSTAPHENILGDLDAALVQVRKRLAENLLDADELVALLATLAKRDPTHLDRHLNLMEETYEYVSHDFDSLDAFQPFLVFAEVFPDRVPNEKMEEAVRDFESLAESAGNDESDPDRVRELATQVEELGSQFGVDTTDYTEGLEEWAKQCEQNSTQEYYDDEWRSAPSSSGFCSDADIESLFSVL
jgi:hypothetical protein